MHWTKKREGETETMVASSHTSEESAMKVSLADIFKEMGVPSNNVWAFFFFKT